jgi:hypothetical protein
MQNLCRQSQTACLVPKLGKQLSGWLVVREQVIVVPLRVNVNLKAITVEELIERRKVCHKAYNNHFFRSFLSQLIICGWYLPFLADTPSLHA